MQKQLSALGSSLFPVPAALVTYRSAAGLPQVVATSWVGIVCTRPAILSVALGPREGARQGVRFGGAFAVNLPAEEALRSMPFLEALARQEAAFTLTEGEVTGAPLIAECPVRIECRQGTVHPGFGQELVRGEVAAVHLDGDSHRAVSPTDLCRLEPFAYPRSRSRAPRPEGALA